MKVGSISPGNIKSLAELMLELWPGCAFEEEYENCKRILNSKNELCYLVEEEENYVAFIYLSLRNDYVEGATASPVAFIEGLYVKPGYRKLGYGTKLVERGEKWAREKGCKQLASDAQLYNFESIEFHKRNRFNEINRVVCFIREL